MSLQQGSTAPLEENTEAIPHAIFLYLLVGGLVSSSSRVHFFLSLEDRLQFAEERPRCISTEPKTVVPLLRQPAHFLVLDFAVSLPCFVLQLCFFSLCNEFVPG